MPGETFACPHCGTRFVSREALAGKKFACKCGEVFLASMEEAGPAEQPAKTPGRRSRSASGAADAAAFPTGRRRVDDSSPLEEGDRGWVRCYIIPPILITLGITIDISQVTWKKPELPSPVAIYPGEMMVLVALAVVTIVVAVVLAAMLLKVNFGRVWIAVLKSASVAIFGTAIFVAVARLDTTFGSIRGMSMGWSSMILIYWALFAVLFELEIHETILTIFVVAVTQAAVMWAVLG